MLRIALAVGAAGEEIAAKLLISGFLVIRDADLETIARAVLPLLQQDFAELMPEARRAASVAELMQVLGSVESASVFPLVVGPVLIKFEGEMLINVAAASQRLFSDLAFPSTADQDAVHEKGNFFESELQAAINGTRCAPPADISALRGRTLKLDGVKLTDIDALFVAAETLAIVSAKSFPFTLRHAAGEHRALRNTITKIENVVRTLMERPRGDNYDLRGFKRVEGIVFTPHVMLVPVGEVTEEVLSGLRRYVSAAELTK